jgi:cytochrome b involved in lipid metabolism
MAQVYSWEEVQKHTEVGDCWIVIDDKVFDVSEFMVKHPGGRWIILEQAGKDASAALRRTIHSEIAFEKLF